MFCDVKKAHIYPAIIYVVTNHTVVCFIRRQNDLKTIRGSQAIPREPQSLPKCLPWSPLKTP